MHIHITSDRLRDSLILLTTDANLQALTAPNVGYSLQLTVKLIVATQQHIVEHAVVEIGVDRSRVTVALTLLHLVLVVGQEAYLHLLIIRDLLGLDHLELLLACHVFLNEFTSRLVGTVH